MAFLIRSWRLCSISSAEGVADSAKVTGGAKRVRQNNMSMVMSFLVIFGSGIYEIEFEFLLLIVENGEELDEVGPRDQFNRLVEATIRVWRNDEIFVFGENNEVGAEFDFARNGGGILGDDLTILRRG